MKTPEHESHRLDMIWQYLYCRWTIFIYLYIYISSGFPHYKVTFTFNHHLASELVNSQEMGKDSACRALFQKCQHKTCGLYKQLKGVHESNAGWNIGMMWNINLWERCSFIRWMTIGRFPTSRLGIQLSDEHHTTSPYLTNFSSMLKLPFNSKMYFQDGISENPLFGSLWHVKQ